MEYVVHVIILIFNITYLYVVAYRPIGLDATLLSYVLQYSICKEHCNKKITYLITYLFELIK